MKSYKKKEIREDFNIFSGIGDFFKGILDIIKNINKIFLFIIKTFIWAFSFGLYLITEVFNPYIIIKDIVEQSYVLPQQIIKAFENLLKNTSKFMTNSLLSPIFNSIFGWDSKKDGENKDCYETKKDEISVSLVLSTILLPPLGIFMKFGLKQWNDILISGGLTMLFYFPGLLFSLVKIFS